MYIDGGLDLCLAAACLVLTYKYAMLIEIKLLPLKPFLTVDTREKQESLRGLAGLEELLFIH